MGFKTVRTSDLSGTDLAEADVVTVLVKGHPDLSENKVLDASAAELKPLKTVTGLVELELKSADGTVKTVYVTNTELAKVIPMDVLQKAGNARGRRTGFRPATNGNGS